MFGSRSEHASLLTTATHQGRAGGLDDLAHGGGSALPVLKTSNVPSLILKGLAEGMPPTRHSRANGKSDPGPVRIFHLPRISPNG